MEILYLSPQDLRWMRHRLGHTVRLTVVMLMVSFLANASATKRDEVAQARTASFEPISLATPGIESGLNPVPPVGWRRTTRGWEHINTWAETASGIRTNDSIQSLLDRQAAEEPAVARSVLARVSGWSPLTFASLQVLAILAITGITRLQRQASPMTAR